jgi:hypothetical protein
LGVCLTHLVSWNRKTSAKTTRYYWLTCL